MSDLEKKNGVQKLPEPGEFPLLKLGIKELQQKILVRVVPEGFYKEGDSTRVKGKKYITSQDIQFLIDEVGNFCHNERVRIIREIENLMTHFRQEYEDNNTKILLEERKNFINRNMSGLMEMKEHETRLICKLQMLEFILKIVNR